MFKHFLHRYLKLPYVLRAVEFRAPTRQTVTVIMLHGIGSSHAMWVPIVKRLPEDTRIIAVDLLGFGASPKPNWNTYNVRTQADSLATTLFSMKIRGPVVVVGHSLGSLVAIEFARRYPLMTKSLVLVSPPLYNPDRIRKRRDFNPDDVLKRMYAIFASKPDAAGKILKLASRYYLANKGIVGATIDPIIYLQTLESSIINQRSYCDILRIKRPIHIVTGRLDAIVLESTIRDVVAQRPNIQRVSAIGGHEITGRLLTATVKEIKTAISEARARDDKTLV
jgi:pimeloyl-ACP methyl ester carboxylesterase